MATLSWEAKKAALGLSADGSKLADEVLADLRQRMARHKAQFTSQRSAPAQPSSHAAPSQPPPVPTRTAAEKRPLQNQEPATASAKLRAVATSDGRLPQTARAPALLPRIQHRSERAPKPLTSEGTVREEGFLFNADNPGEVTSNAAPAIASAGAAPKPPPLVMRGRLRSHLEEWEKWVDNPLVLSWVREGFPLAWENGTPPPPHHGRNHQSAFDHADFVDQAISDLLAAKSIEPLPSKPHTVCPLGVVQRGEKLRLIYDGRPINDHLHSPTFRYEDLKAVPGFLLPGDFMFTLDLKSGYHHVDIRPDCWTYLGFEWRGQFYCFTQLPFGVSSACWAFTKLMREVLRGWRRRGWRCGGLLDDQFHAEQDAATLVRRRELIVSQLERMGFVLNREKSMLGEVSQRIKYLGMFIDTQRGVFEVPGDKRERVLAAIASALAARRLPVRTIACIKGQLLAMSWAFGPWSRLRTRGLGHLIETRRSWSSHVAVSPEAEEDLLFWQAYFDHFNGRRSLWRPSHVHTLMHCDAAGKNGTFPGGWGAWTVLDGKVVTARGEWDSRVSSYGSTPQELQAVLNGLRSFRSPAGLDGQVVRVMTDNLNAANIINKGSAKADNCYTVAYELLWYCVEHDIRLDAQWIPRDKNKYADYLSKIQEPDNWTISDSVFTSLSKAWGPFDIDLFASHHNHRLPAFYAAHHVPGAAGVDAFRFRWGRACWAYPPFGLLLRVLQHAQACRARLCLLAPVWPTRDWWPYLTGNGETFKGFVHGVRVLGKLRDVVAAGQPVPRRSDSWAMMALLIDFARDSPSPIAVPSDPSRARPQTPPSGAPPSSAASPTAPTRSWATWRRASQ